MGTDPRSVSEIRDALARLAGASLRSELDELADDPRAGVKAACKSAAAREESRLTELRRLRALYRFERDLLAQGLTLVAGVDEVGRGALAGPLTAAACILPLKPMVLELDDSKRLSPAKRAVIAERVKETAITWAVAHVDATDVDALGLTAALRRAMGRSLAGLQLDPDHVVIDGLPLGVVAGESAVVGGDRKVAAIAAASVLAKVTRDALMTEFSEVHPAYGFDVNKGYGTPEHLTAISTHGLCPLHRASFCPGGGTQSLF